MRNLPGKNDRLIGQHELGGYGGGSYVCPIFSSADTPGVRETQNFGFDLSNIPEDRADLEDRLQRFIPRTRDGTDIDRIRRVVPPLGKDPYDDPGMVTVLNIPSMFFYAIETHYGIDETHAPGGETPEERKKRLLNCQILNWFVLVTRAVDDPTNPKQVAAFLKTALVKVKLTSPVDAKPDPRVHMVSVQTTMGGQIVERKSFATVVGNDARILRRREVQERVDALRRRTELFLDKRLGRF